MKAKEELRLREAPECYGPSIHALLRLYRNQTMVAAAMSLLAIPLAITAGITEQHASDKNQGLSDWYGLLDIVGTLAICCCSWLTVQATSMCAHRTHPF